MHFTFRKMLAIAGSAMALIAATERFDLKVRNYFFAGFQGDQAALDKGMKMAEEELATNPGNAEALVWHGSGLYYEAGQEFRKGDAQRGQELFMKSMQEMDKGVQLAPDAVGVRIPRGAVLLAGTRFMNPEMARPLIEKAVGDYERAKEVQSGGLDKLNTHAKGELLIGLADGYARLGNEAKAKSYYEQLIQDLPGTPYAKAGQRYLETKVAQPGCLGCHTGS